MAHYDTMQAVVGLLLDGHERQAVLAWNSARLTPPLRGLTLSHDGAYVLIEPQHGEAQRLALDDLLDELEREDSAETLREV